MEEQEEDGNPPEMQAPVWQPSGYSLTNDIRIASVINSENEGPIDALWHKGGGSLTDGGHEVLWGYFYASPDDVNWGNPNNPDLFVKVWFDASGRIDVNFFHVSVPNIEVYSDFPNQDDYDKKGTRPSWRIATLSVTSIGSSISDLQAQVPARPGLAGREPSLPAWLRLQIRAIPYPRSARIGKSSGPSPPPARLGLANPGHPPRSVRIGKEGSIPRERERDVSEFESRNSW